jgi:flagellar motor switch/type III secretory pathway protein FliN
MDADAPRTRSSATASMPDLRLHNPGRDSEPISVRFPRLSAKNTSIDSPPRQATVVLGTARKTQAELDRIRNGDVLVLDRPADSPLALFWQDKIVAWVELVQVEGVNVWRVAEAASSEAREVEHE